MDGALGFTPAIGAGDEVLSYRGHQSGKDFNWPKGWGWGTLNIHQTPTGFVLFLRIW
jgi:hypothetical protein